MRALRGVIVLVLALALPAPVLAADYEAGWEAYNRGDYATAWEEWLPLAEQGHAAAQSNLGLMYSSGHGVPQDYAVAAKWYRRAAEQGFARAQFNLGTMYEHGKSVAQDYAEAARWYELAAAQGDPDAQNQLGFLYVTDAGGMAHGMPGASLVARSAEQVAAADGLHLVALDSPALLEFYPASEIPAGTYPWQAAGVPVIAVKATLMTYDFPQTSKYLRDSCAAVARTARAIQDNIGWLRAHGHPKWRQVDLTLEVPGWSQSACVRDGLDPAEPALVIPAAASSAGANSCTEDCQAEENPVRRNLCEMKCLSDGQ